MIISDILGIKWFNFFFHYFESNSSPPTYFEYEQDQIIDTNVQPKEPPLLPKANIFIVNCIPPYLKPELQQLRNGLKSFSRYYRKGYLLEFKGFENADDFVRSTLGSKGFKDIRRKFRRLKADHSVYFKVFTDHIQQSEFDYIMTVLKEMIIKRFTNRGIPHDALNRWSLYLLSAYKMINEGKASLFVYYEKEKPIAIGFNYHDGENFFSAITSYDTSYSNYGLGKLMLIKKISWCFENNYERLDLGWGNLYYKRKMANVVYKYKTETIYKTKSPLSGIIAWIMGYLLEIKYIWSDRNK